MKNDMMMSPILQDMINSADASYLRIKRSPEIERQRRIMKNKGKTIYTYKVIIDNFYVYETGVIFSGNAETAKSKLILKLRDEGVYDRCSITIEPLRYDEDIVTLYEREDGE